jgi:hypothetical protein
MNNIHQPLMTSLSKVIVYGTLDTNVPYEKTFMGLDFITYKITYINGIEISRKIV